MVKPLKLEEKKLTRIGIWTKFPATRWNKHLKAPHNNYSFFFKMGHARSLFLYVNLFFFNVQMVDKILPMLGFKPLILGTFRIKPRVWEATPLPTVPLQLFILCLLDYGCVLDWQEPYPFSGATLGSYIIWPKAISPKVSSQQRIVWQRQS